MHCGRGLLVHMVHLPSCVHATKSATAAFGPTTRITATTAAGNVLQIDRGSPYEQLC